MEDEKFPKNSDSKIIDTGPPVESSVDPPVSNTGDPPNDSALDKGSPPGNQSKAPSFLSRVVKRLKRTTLVQRTAAAVLSLIFIVTAAIQLVNGAGIGDGGSVGQFTFKKGGYCPGEIQYYPMMMVSPVKLFNYFNLYEAKDGKSKQVGPAFLLDGGKITCSDGKKYTLKPDEYYGGTIMGYNKGALIMPSSAIYSSEFQLLASYLSDKSVLCDHLQDNGDFDGNNKSSSHIVYFRKKGDGSPVTSINDIGVKDPENGNFTNTEKHIFTSALVSATGNDYDPAQFVEKLKDGKWMDVIQTVPGYRKQCFELWEAISYVKDTGSSYELNPLDKIIKYISPNYNNLLNTNFDDDNSQVFRDMGEKRQELVYYHELDLLMTLYVLASENKYTVADKRDTELPEIWAKAIENYIVGWDDPTKLKAAEVENSTHTSFNTIVVTPVVIFRQSTDGGGNQYHFIPASDYVENSLGIQPSATTRKPGGINNYFSNDLKNDNSRMYIYNLYKKALAKSQPSECPAVSVGAGSIGCKSYLWNVMGRRTEITKNGNKYSMSLSSDTANYKNMIGILRTREKVWGSNLIFLDTWKTADKFELPQFSVNLSMESEHELDKDNNSVVLPGEMEKVNTIDEQLKLNFNISSNIENNQDDYFQKLVDDGKRKVRDKEDNAAIFEAFMKNSETKDMSISYHLKRFVCVDDIQGVLAADGSKKEGTRASTFELDKEAAEGKKAKTSGKGSMEKATAQFSFGLGKIVADDATKEQAYKTASDEVIQNQVKANLKGDTYQVSDVWVSYKLPDITESNSDSSIYRYGLMRSALGENLNAQINNALRDATLKEYGVFLTDKDEKEIEVVYKIEEAYINYTNTAYETMEAEAKLYQPYAENKNYVDGDSALKKHVSIRAAGTGDAVRILYKFKPFPPVDLKPEVKANVGGTLAQTASGGTTNPKETGIEDTDAKFDTKEGYIKNGSETISDVPSVTFGFTAEGTEDEWAKLLNKDSKEYDSIFLCMTVERELSSEGTIPDNADTVPWTFNFGANPKFKTTAKTSGSNPIETITNGRWAKITNYIYGKLTPISLPIIPEATELRGQSMSELAQLQNPGKKQYAVFSIRLDGDGNKTKFLNLLNNSQTSIGDTEAPETNTGNTADLKITQIGGTNNSGLKIEKTPGKNKSGHEMFTLLDYSIAELNTAGMTDVKANYTISVTLYAGVKNTKSVIEKNFKFSLRSSMKSALVGGEGEPGGSETGEGSSESSESASDTAVPEGYSDYVVYYPSDVQRDLVLDTAVNPNDSSTFATDTNTADPVTSTADNNDYKSEHKDTGKNKIYSRKAYVKMSVLSL